jgi:hypothetical protein
MDIFEGARLYKLFPQHVVASCMQRDVEPQEVSAVDTAKYRECNILDSDQLSGIKSFVEEQIALYVKNVLKPRNDVSLKLSTSWARHGNDDHTMFRVNSFISGIFYLRTELGAILQFHSGQKRDGLYIPTYAPNELNMDICDVEVGDGYLLLFPSRIPYRSITGESSLYIGFNTFPAGWLGDEGEIDSFKVD